MHIGGIGITGGTGISARTATIRIGTTGTTHTGRTIDTSNATTDMAAATATGSTIDVVAAQFRGPLAWNHEMGQHGAGRCINSMGTIAFPAQATTDSILVPHVDHQHRPKDTTSRGPPSTGDAASFDNLDEFLASVEHRAYHMSYYALRDEQTALDVVQDAMLKLVENYADRPRGEWPALFFTILHNRITDIHRWHKLRVAGGKLISLFRVTDDAPYEQNLLDRGAGVDLRPEHHEPEQQTLSKQLRRRINDAIDQLSERQRQVFLLREWQGFNVRDTATILGCSEGSVKQHHFRAMRTLRAELAEVWNND